uniref:5-formyltetrahydrofolate cyclo-ligase n=1 Tax=Phallusia mammillata TaxID=59560 RepID=A0A6F9DM59_9ASCI|nr:5-formyltetrahydrofolate cyclo-ligase-like [Phallusia mammillata]
MQAAKQTLRKQIKLKLKNMTDAERTSQTSSVVQKLLRHKKYKESSRISVYLSMANEIQTSEILAHALGAGKKVYIPKYVGENMDMVRLASMDDYNSLPETKWKIKQPPDADVSRENALDSGGLDLIVVPGVGFTPSGDRLGHGKGYYDTYIEKANKIKIPYLIGLAYSVQMCETIPTSDHDKPLNEVLTCDKPDN